MNSFGVSGWVFALCAIGSFFLGIGIRRLRLRKKAREEMEIRELAKEMKKQAKRNKKMAKKAGKGKKTEGVGKE